MNASSSSSSWEGARPSGGGSAPRAAHAAPPSQARRKKKRKSAEGSSRRTEERPYSEDQLRQGVLLVLKGLPKRKAAARIGFPSAASTLGRYAAEARKIPLVLAACEADGDDGDGVLRAHVATITFKERGSPEFNERSMFSTDARGFFAAAIKLFSQLGFPRPRSPLELRNSLGERFGGRGADRPQPSVLWLVFRVRSVSCLNA